MTLTHIAEKSMDLTSLGEKDARVILEKVIHLHATAYSWHPSIDLEEVLRKTKGSRLRTRIRYTMETLDLAYLYPAQKVSTEIKKLEEVHLDEDDRFFTSAGDDEGSSQD
jgi:hypothetical protein